MCATELTWNTLKVYNWVLVKHIWWNWHAVPGTAYWNMGHTTGTLRKIGIYFILRNNWHIDVPWNISKIFYWISFFFCSTHGFGIELYDILYSVFYKLYIIVNWCTWLAHTLCRVLLWNYKNCWAQPWLSFGILQALWCSWECIRYFFFFFDWYRILFRNVEICTISLFSFGWWYTLMKNKHQLSLHLGLKKNG